MSGSDSVDALVAELLPGAPPASVFDKESELPPWLRDAKDDELCAIEAAAANAAGYPEATKTYWVKFVSVDTLHRAVEASPHVCKEELGTCPLRVYVMPTASLYDAHLMSKMAGGAQLLPVKVNVTVHNGVDLDNKVYAYSAACNLLKCIKQVRGEAEAEGQALRLRADPKIKHAEDMLAAYQEAKAAYDALPEMGLCDEQLRMMAALTRLSVAQQVAAAMQQAAAAMASVANSVAKTAEELEAQIRRPSFMGCGK